MKDTLDASDQVRTNADAAATVARALAHPARVRIVALLLARPGCIGYDIVEEIGLAQSTVSEHLRILKSAGVVTGEIARPRICYALDPAAFAPLAALLAAVATHGETAADCRTEPSA